MVKRKKVTHLLLMFVLCFSLAIGPFLSHPKAATNTGNGTFTQGCYSWVYAAAGSEWFNIGVSGMQIHIELDQSYTIQLIVNITGITSFADYGYYVEGAQIVATSLNQIKVKAVQERVIDIYVFSTKAYNASQSWTVSVSKDTSFTSTSYGNEVATVKTISTAVSNIYTGVTNIHNDLTSVISALNTMSGYIDGIEAYIDSLEVYGFDTVMRLDDLLDYNEIIANCSRIQTFELWQQNALFWALKQGELNFDTNLPYVTINTSNNSGNYTNANRIRLTANAKIYFYYYVDVSSSSSDWNVYYQNTPTTEVTKGAYQSTFSVTYPLYLYRLEITNNMSSTIYIELEFNKNGNIFPLYLGSSEFVPDEISVLFGSDFNNTYSRLLQSLNSGVSALIPYIDQLEGYTDNVESLLTQIKNSISDISGDSTVVNQTQTTINNYETTFNTVNNIENNVLVDFSSDLQDVNVSINNSGILGDLPAGIGNGVTWFDYSFSLVQGIPLFKYPVYVILVLFVLGCLLG